MELGDGCVSLYYFHISVFEFLAVLLVVSAVQSAGMWHAVEFLLWCRDVSCSRACHDLAARETHANADLLCIHAAS